MNVVILAAGKGKRMHSDLPKVLHPLAGKPLLAHVLATARELGATSICVVYGHGGEQVREALDAPDLVWAKQDPQLGTGHAVLQALPHLAVSPAPTLVLYGDVPLTRASTLQRLIDAAGDDALGLLTAHLDNPQGYGRIVRVDGQVTRIVEEKDADDAERAIGEINTGILVAPTAALARWLPTLGNRNAQGEYYLTDIVALAVAEGMPVVTAHPEASWETEGVNSKVQLALLEREHQQQVAGVLMEAGVTLADPKRIDVRGRLQCGRDVAIDVNCVFEGQVELADAVSIGANCVLKNCRIGRGAIAPFCHIEDAVVGEQSIIGPYARLRPGTELGRDVHIGNFVEVKNSSIADHSKANHLAYVGDATIGSRVNVGAGTITCNYDGANKFRTVIEDDVFIGSDTQLVAPVTVGRGATLGAGTTLTRDAPPDQLTVSRAKQVSIPGWKRPVKKKKDRAMCGIVAAVAARNIVPVLIEGLTRLEYRGYDSAGLALLNPALIRLRSVGRVAELATQAAGQSARQGIAHTRWATHGVPSERNAHPHVSAGLAVVHNGIIENYAELKQELLAAGYVFSSDTDTEVIAHLILETLKSSADLFQAVQNAATRLIGAYAIAVLREGDETIVVARHGAPLLLGLSEDGHYAASDASALLQVTRRMIYLEDGDVAELRRDAIRIVGAGGTPIERSVHESTLSADDVELGDYRHYMQKEIFEQPQALAATLELIGGAQAVSPNLFGVAAPEMLNGVRSVLILACGTSFHAGLVARYWIEQLAGIPCSVEIASEYRYRVSVPNPEQLVVAISQSGETADTLASVKHAKALGMGRTLAICNVPESAIVRECALRFLTRAGPEIGVASTKAFTTQLAALFLLAVTLAKQAGRLGAGDEVSHLQALRHLPVAVQKVLALEPGIKAWAERFADKQHALFLGRGHHYPIALEGALKLKEISYIHAEGYPAGELKHGPLALVDKDMPVISIAPNDALLEKLKSNLKEVAARGGELYVFADADSAVDAEPGVHIMRLPEHYGMLSPVLHVVPLQLLSYHVALVKGTDVDKPRNLAKSVTVE